MPFSLCAASAVARLASGASTHPPSIATLQRYLAALGCRVEVRLIKRQPARVSRPCEPDLPCSRPPPQREIGVRVALGARRAAFAMRRWFFGFHPLDPVTCLLVAAIAAGSGVLASYLPARRALAVNPVVALRCE